MTDTPTLQRLVANRLAELDLTFRAASRKSGGLVSHASLNNIALGKHTGGISDDVARGIALAIDVPLSEVLEAAGKSGVEPTEFRLPKRASQLTPAQRRLVLNMVNALLDATDESD